MGKEQTAFPCNVNEYCGMLLRDYFAAQILPSLMLRWKEPGYSDDSAIHESYRLADLMLAERNKEQPNA